MTEATLSPAVCKIAYDQFQLYSLAAWIESNGYKPHLIIQTEYPGVQLPPASMAKPMETINFHSSAISRVDWQDDQMVFGARFGGKEFKLVIPYRSVVALNFAGTSTFLPTPWGAITHASKTSAPEPAVSTQSATVETPSTTSVEESVPAPDEKSVLHVDFRNRKKK